MNQPHHDPLGDYFASDWTASLSNESPPFSPDFSTAVLKKIVLNKRKERLFYVACISVIFAVVVAIMVFVYPGYKQFDAMFAGIALFFAEITHSLGSIVTQPSSSSLISIPLLFYIPLLTVALLGLDALLRKHRHARSTYGL
ncbi:MAG: hypothetical protein LBC84_00710 [Prevotellaceae bacterium]|jgi:hypothetical protein|nr:hypothetical protein [Prevotellaceae bacterium]